jgi:hypothetical protein
MIAMTISSNLQVFHALLCPQDMWVIKKPYSLERLGVDIKEEIHKRKS